MTFEIKAIIFDYGNVLCEAQPAEDIGAMAAELNMAVPEFVTRYWRDREAYDRTNLDATEYWSRLAGRPLDAAEVALLVQLDTRSWTHPNRKTISFAQAASDNGLRIALLSNLPIALRDALETDCPWLPRFDVRTYSCTVRKTKPDAAIYDACVRDLNLKPPEIVFLDDRPANVQGALAVGIHAIQFESFDRAALELEAKYGIQLTREDQRHAG